MSDVQEAFLEEPWTEGRKDPSKTSWKEELSLDKTLDDIVSAVSYTHLYIFKCDENHELHLIKTFDQMEPNWLSDEKGIDLTKDAPNEQYTPLD